MNNLNFLKEEIKKKKIKEINPILFYQNFDKIVEEINLIFYKSFFPDLSEFTEIELIYHYYDMVF